VCIDNTTITVPAATSSSATSSSRLLFSDAEALCSSLLSAILAQENEFRKVEMDDMQQIMIVD
jgi:hypothetical protein